MRSFSASSANFDENSFRVDIFNAAID